MGGCGCGLGVQGTGRAAGGQARQQPGCGKGERSAGVWVPSLLRGQPCPAHFTFPLRPYVWRLGRHPAVVFGELQREALYRS